MSKTQFRLGVGAIFAATEGNNEVAALLIAKGADVNAKNNVGRTPLH